MNKSGSLLSNKNPVGRPPGTTQNAVSVLTLEIIQSVKLMRDIREMVKEETKKIQKYLSGEKDMGVESRIKIMMQLTEMIQTIGGAVGEAAKCLNIVRVETKGEGGEFDVEAFLKKEMGV